MGRPPFIPVTPRCNWLYKKQEAALVLFVVKTFWANCVAPFYPYTMPQTSQMFFLFFIQPSSGPSDPSIFCPERGQVSLVSPGTPPVPLCSWPLSGPFQSHPFPGCSLGLWSIWVPLFLAPLFWPLVPLGPTLSVPTLASGAIWSWASFYFRVHSPSLSPTKGISWKAAGLGVLGHPTLVLPCDLALVSLSKGCCAMSSPITVTPKPNRV